MQSPQPKFIGIGSTSWFPIGSENKKNKLKLGHKVKRVNKGGSSAFGVRKIRGLVSKKKRRFQQDGFDLDLSYITPQIIAMGFPSSKSEGIYRNPMTEVQRFCAQRHPEAFEIINLCSERSYEAEKFGGRVACYPFDDHNPPMLEMIPQFCKHVSKYLSTNPNSLAAIHCKAGKGRTGTIISAWMVYAKMFGSAQEAMSMFAIMRTHDSKGVTIPSQKRYIEYTEQWVKNGPWKPRYLVLKSIDFGQSPNFSKLGGCNVIMTVSVGPEKTKLLKTKPRKIKRNQTDFSLILDQELLVSGDIRLQFHHKPVVGKPEKMFHLWFHTSFIPSSNTLHLKKNDLDKAIKDKTCKHFSEEFSININFSNPNNVSSPESLILESKAAATAAAGDDEEIDSGTDTEDEEDDD